MTIKFDEALVGTKLTENLLIEQYLGAGGMGVTYKAFQPTMSRSVCVKFLSAAAVTDSASFERFKREALILSKLAHPGIVQCYFFGLLENIYPFFAMEFVDGRNLRDILREDVRLPWQSACRIVAESCIALGYAHAQGFLHRDIKPDNIMIVNSDDCEVKLLDFGLASVVGPYRGDLTETGMIVGSLPYMPPEAIKGQRKDAELKNYSDIYSLGCVLFELLSGQPPYSGENALELMSRHCKSPIPSLPDDCAPPHITKALNQLLCSAMAKDPADRFKDCAEMLAEIEAIMAMNSCEAPSTPQHVLRQGGFKHGLAMYVAAAVALIICLVPLFIRPLIFHPASTPEAISAYRKSQNVNDLKLIVECLAHDCRTNPSFAVEANQPRVRICTSQIARQLWDGTEAEVRSRAAVLSSVLADLRYMQAFYRDRQPASANMMRNSELDILIASQDYSTAWDVISEWYRSLGRPDLITHDRPEDLEDKAVLHAFAVITNVKEGKRGRNQQVGVFELGHLLLNAFDSKQPLRGAGIVDRLKTLMPRVINTPKGTEIFRSYVNNSLTDDEKSSTAKLLLTHTAQFAAAGRLHPTIVQVLRTEPAKADKTVCRALGELLIAQYNRTPITTVSKTPGWVYGEVATISRILCDSGLGPDLLKMIDQMELHNRNAQNSPVLQAYLELLKIRIFAEMHQDQNALQTTVQLRSAQDWRAAIDSDVDGELRDSFIESMWRSAYSLGANRRSEVPLLLLTAAAEEFDKRKFSTESARLGCMLSIVCAYSHLIQRPQEVFPLFRQFFSDSQTAADRGWLAVSEPYLAHHLMKVGMKDEARIHYERAVPLILDDVASDNSRSMPGGFASLFAIYLRQDGFHAEGRQVEQVVQAALRAAQ